MLIEVHIVKAMISPVVMSGCEIWTINKAFLLKNWWFWTVSLEKILEIPLDSKEIKPVNPKGNLPWIFIEKDWCLSWSSSSNTLASWYKEPIHWKRLWYWERLKAGVEEDNRGWNIWWHHWLNGHEFEQALGDSEGQRSLFCCSPCDHKESDTTEWLNSALYCVIH